MILCDRTLRAMLAQFVSPADYGLVNPASVDLQLGAELLLETRDGWTKHELADERSKRPFVLRPGEFALVATHERLMVPNGYAMEFRLKSTAARAGFEHALAVWFDPGWDGIATLELRNGNLHHPLLLYRFQRLVQFMVHVLDGLAEHPYQGRYNRATGVEVAKPEKTGAR